MMDRTRLLYLLAALCAISLHAGEESKQTLKSNMQVVYNQTPTEVENIAEMFSEGIFYGRLRANSFFFDWEDENNGKDHAIAGFGGSLIYKTGYFNGFGITTGIYTTHAIGSLDNDEANYYKAGKAMMSRYDARSGNNPAITSIAQAYLEYKNKDLSLKAGRQIFESFLTKSNDTKMIPNTFEGITLSGKGVLDSSYKLAYLTRQKLRDHSSFHHLLAYGDGGTDPYVTYTENDDSAMHQGLTLSALQAAGIEDRLFIFEAANKSIDNLTLTANYTAVPDLISSVMMQADYQFNVGKMKVKPALRYMKQFDDGAGAIGGANLKNDTTGYTDPDNLDSELYAARIDLAQDAWKLRFGYTKVADEGDLVAPWRGFPTGGFSRAMAQYNWYANTQTYMIRADYDFSKAGLVPGLKAFMRYAIQDFDDSKAGVQADSNVLTVDLLKEFNSVPGLYMKARFAYANGDDGTPKSDPSYKEFRFEVNYLF
jgi:hypothetical protein